MNPSSRPATEVSLAGDLRTLLRILLGKWLLIGLCTLGALLLGLLHLRSTPPIYAAQTIIQVAQEEKKVLKIEGVQSEDLKSLEVLKTIEQNIVSPEVLLRVIHNHDLEGNPDFLPEVPKPHTDSALQAALSRHIHAKIRRGTRLIDIQVEHTNPALSQRIAALLVEEFARWNFAVQRQAGQMASDFLLEEAERLKARLAKSEQAIQAYKEQHETVSLEERQNIIVDKLKELNLRVTEAKAGRLKLEADCGQLRPGVQQPLAELLQIPGVAGAPEIAALKRSLSDREAALAILAQRYKPEHPRYRQAAGELATLKNDLEDSARKAAQVLAATYDAAQLNERKLEEALADQQKLALELNKIAIPYAVLARDMESDRALYDSVLTRLKETDITKDIAQDAVRVVSRPLLPDRPVKPVRSLIMAISLLGGLAVGCGLAFVSYAADPALRSLPEAETRLALRALGEIPRLPRSLARQYSGGMLAALNAPATDSFRSLRNSLALLGHDGGPKTLLLTSAQPGEGSTFCALHCAVSLAQTGLKTLLVDADFRSPQLAEALSCKSAGRQLRALRHEGPTWESRLQSSAIPHLSVLTVAHDPAEAGDFFNSANLEAFMAWATERFERVVFDSAPVLVAGETLLLAKRVEAVCLILRAGRTPAEAAERALQRLADAGAPLAGFIWNQSKKTAIPASGRFPLKPASRHDDAQAPTGTPALAVVEQEPAFEVSTNGGETGPGHPPHRP